MAKRDEIFRRDQGLSLDQDDAVQATLRGCRGESRSHIGTKKLDLKSNCGPKTA